jgi:hypothetical protein
MPMATCSTISGSGRCVQPPQETVLFRCGCGTRCVDRAGINEPAANCGRHIQTDRRASADGSARPGLSTGSNVACCAKLRCKSDVMMPNRLAPTLSRYRLEPREGASVSSKFKRRSPRLATCSSPQRAADLRRILPIGMKSVGRAHWTETEIATSTLPRIAFEYGQMA